MPKESFICVMCGTQFGPADQEPNECPICNDDRQYVRRQGQMWTTMAKLRLGSTVILSLKRNPTCSACKLSPNSLSTRGRSWFRLMKAICYGTAFRWSIMSFSGLKGIAVSHPHYYTAMVEWSKAFGEVPIYLHQNDSRWVMRPDNCVHFWEGEQYSLFGGLSLVSTGGHFEGFQVLYWPAGAEGRGVLPVGDQPFVVQDRRWVSFMYSYPNLIPLAPDAIHRIVDRLAPLRFDRLYGAFPEQLLTNGAKETVKRSAIRYLQALGRSSQ